MCLGYACIPEPKEHGQKTTAVKTLSYLGEA